MIRLIAAVAGALALAVAGCGGDTNAEPQGVGGNTPLRLANCEDWNGSGPEERLVTVGQLEALNRGPLADEGIRGVVLSEDEAYDLLERYCEQSFASQFKLYKLYGRAAAFHGS